MDAIKAVRQHQRGRRVTEPQTRRSRPDAGRTDLGAVSDSGPTLRGPWHSSDLYSEMDRACTSVGQRHIDAMIALGITSNAIAQLGRRQPPFGVGQISEIGGGHFEFFPGGQSRVIMPVMEDGEIIDLIAWQTCTPGKWLWRKGLGNYLGGDLIARSQWTDHHALILVATPLDWLCAAGEAVCILNLKAPSAELERIRFVDEIVVTDAALGRQIAKVMAAPRPIPRITTLKPQTINGGMS